MNVELRAAEIEFVRGIHKIEVSFLVRQCHLESVHVIELVFFDRVRQHIENELPWFKRIDRTRCSDNRSCEDAVKANVGADVDEYVARLEHRGHEPRLRDLKRSQDNSP